MTLADRHLQLVAAARAAGRLRTHFSRSPEELRPAPRPQRNHTARAREISKRIDELDDGTRLQYEIAALVPCAESTVSKHLAWKKRK